MHCSCRPGSRRGRAFWPRPSPRKRSMSSSALRELSAPRRHLSDWSSRRLSNRICPHHRSIPDLPVLARVEQQPHPLGVSPPLLEQLPPRLLRPGLSEPALQVREERLDAPPRPRAKVEVVAPEDHGGC